MKIRVDILDDDGGEEPLRQAWIECGADMSGVGNYITSELQQIRRHTGRLKLCIDIQELPQDSVRPPGLRLVSSM